MARAISASRALIAQRFKALRISAGMRPSVVYRALEIPHSTFSSIENGQILPNLITCGRLCAFYDAPVDFILTGTGLNRKLEMPREAAVMLKHIMTPIDLHEPRPNGKAGFLTFKVAALPPAEFDLRRVLLRSPASEVKAAVKEIKQAPAVEEAPKSNFLRLKTPPATKPKKAKKSKFNLGTGFDAI